MNTLELTAKINKAQETFLAQRAKLEAMVDAWAKKVALVKPEIWLGVELPNVELTLRGLIPELYAEDFDPVRYEEQFAQAQELIQHIKAIVAQHNRIEAERELKPLGYDIDSMTLADTISAGVALRERELAQRAKLEVEVANWATKIRNLDPALLEGVQLPEDLTLQGLVPELYKQNRNKELCQEQIQAAKSLTESINAIVLRYVEEAEKCLSEYQERASVL